MNPKRAVRQSSASPERTSGHRLRLQVTRKGDVPAVFVNVWVLVCGGLPWPQFHVSVRESAPTSWTTPVTITLDPDLTAFVIEAYGSRFWTVTVTELVAEAAWTSVTWRVFVIVVSSYQTSVGRLPVRPDPPVHA